MEAALEGFVIGLAIALFLLAAEYFLLKRASGERARRLKREALLDDTERRRLHTMVRFCIVVPPAFAGFFWLIWG